MKIKMLCSRVGPDISDSRGDIIEVEDDEAGRMIEAGQAISVETTSKTPAKEFAYGKGKGKGKK
jgi:hypothetical protein